MMAPTTRSERVRDPQRLAVLSAASYDYAAAIDAGDLESLRKLISDDVELDRGHETIHGADAVLEFYRALAESGRTNSQHMITNLRAFGEEGRYLVEATFLMISTAGDTATMAWGRYFDELAIEGETAIIAVKRIRVSRVATIPQGMLASAGTPAFAREERN
jgi:ketosteroid isomerase-like protein